MKLEEINMARPTTKADLQEVAAVTFTKLWDLLQTMTPAEQTGDLQFGEDFQGKEAHWTRDQNTRDVLIHLYEWHQLLLKWVQKNQHGEAVHFLPAPYNWRSYAQMNVEFVKKHQQTSYKEAEALLKKSHEAVMAMIDSFSNEELFSKNSLPWTGNSTLGSYCVSSTSSHYDWALKKLKKYLKTVRAAK
jgi:hypothetical protein